MNLDPADGRPVQMELDLAALQHSYPKQSWFDPKRNDMWRYGALLPLDPQLAEDAQHIVTLGGGPHPLAGLFQPSDRTRWRLPFVAQG